MEVKEIGSYIETDDDGYLINPTSIEKLQEKWLPVVEELKQEYIKHFNGDLVSIYIRGSVAKGEAIDHVSDIDSFAIVSLSDEEIDTSWRGSFNKYVQEKYPFVEGVEIRAVPVNELSHFKGDQIMIKTQSVCIYGKEFANDISPMKPGIETAQHVKGIEREINKTKEWLGQEHTDEQIKKKCTWIMKRILRSGFELVMELSQMYTRDLYRCYEGFSKYYPERKEEMYEVLELAINPTTDRTIIQDILADQGIWLVEGVATIFGPLQK